MIRLLESNDSGFEMYEEVSCAGYKWYIISINGDTATLLSAESFGKSMYSEKNDKDEYSYKDSLARKYLLDKVLPELESKGAKPIPTNLSDVGCTDKLWLLSLREAQRLGSTIREGEVLHCSGDWWLRTPRGDRHMGGGWIDYAASVGWSGTLTAYPVDRKYGVRPAMRIKLENIESLKPAKADTSEVNKGDQDKIVDELREFVDKYGEDVFTLFGMTEWDGCDDFFLDKLDEIPSFKSSSVSKIKYNTLGKGRGIDGYFDLFLDDIREEGSGWHSGYVEVPLNKVWVSSDPATQYIIDNTIFFTNENSRLRVRYGDIDDEEGCEVDLSFGDIL